MSEATKAITAMPVLLLTHVAGVEMHEYSDLSVTLFPYLPKIWGRAGRIISSIMIHTSFFLWGERLGCPEVMTEFGLLEHETHRKNHCSNSSSPVICCRSESAPAGEKQMESMHFLPAPCLFNVPGVTAGPERCRRPFRINRKCSPPKRLVMG